ncbi:MAG: isoprenylcysteine carboxylmethyltransferase family protein [Rhizobiaceae bacterium]
MTPTAFELKRSSDLARYQRYRRLWLFIGILLIGGIFMMVKPAWTSAHVAEQIEFAGAGLIWTGIVGRLWSILYIGGYKASTVITDGPYSVMRNPLYFFSTIAAIGVGLQSGAVTAGVVFGLLCYIAFQIVIRREEKFLGQSFGADYQAYLETVPRFFPDVRLFHDRDTREISTGKMYSTLLDGLVFFIALPLFEFAEYLQEAGVIPVLFNLY